MVGIDRAPNLQELRFPDKSKPISAEFGVGLSGSMLKIGYAVPPLIDFAGASQMGLLERR